MKRLMLLATASMQISFSAPCLLHAQLPTTTVDVAPHPLFVAVNPKTQKIYVTNFLSNTVTVIR